MLDKVIGWTILAAEAAGIGTDFFLSIHAELRYSPAILARY